MNETEPSVKEKYLQNGERIDDLQRNGLYIIQDPGEFCFGMDAVLLSGFAAAHAPASCNRILDLCTGGGIIPLLLAAKTKARHITGIEIQQKAAGRADRSVRMNGLSDKIDIINGDIKEAPELMKAASFDMVTVNPPYFRTGHGIINPTDSKTVSRHEVACTLDDVLSAAEYALKNSGTFCMVHKPQRLADVICVMRDHHIEPKALKTVHPRIGDDPSMILIEGRKGAGEEIRIEAPLVIYNDKDEYTEEMYTIYGY
ncbi:MAG: tRNA1(Val) (adenine(37)-N6)-methyltransferase [Lachnospiraceae bacterium]|nr:tRNA1(Val) (adenine(37)-N6)-methyltransferase [Lachnospiraceae bacterium]